MVKTVLFLAVAAGTAQAVGNGLTTNAIKFGGLPGAYTYQRATSLHAGPNGVQCPLGNVQANGPLAPLTNEMHHVLRGPMNLKQFAVYEPKSGSAKRDTIRESTMERRGRISHLNKHKVKHAEKRGEHLEKRIYGQWVTATINGQVVSFIDDWSPHATPAAVQPVAAPQPVVTSEPVANQQNVQSNPVSNTNSENQNPGRVNNNDWNRIAYFDANSKTTENIAFTANNNFAMGFGFMQGYVASDAVNTAQSPQILSGFIPDNYEVIVSSGHACSAGDTTGGCAVTAPGSTAHHGFGGDRIVVMEYTMPQSQCSNCGNKYTGMSANTNLPAIWALGSDTVNIAQYGLGPGGVCSGWTAGAGEFDIHEILPGGVDTNIGYASFHMGQHYSGTPPEGFPRPSNPNKTQKLAYVLSGTYAGIHILGDNFDMDEGLSADDVKALISGVVPSNSPVKAHMKIANSGAPAYPADMETTSFTALLHS